MNLNATNIIDFIFCPARFYYRAIRKIDTDLVETPELIFGRNMHQVIENYPSKWQSYGEAVKKFLHLFEDNRDKFMTQLKVFSSNFKDLLSEDDLIEVNFKLETDFPDVFITGRIDRITKNGSVIDWKTGNIKDDLSTNIQAILYTNSFLKIFNDEPKNVLFCSLKNGKVVSYSKTAENKKIENLLYKEIIPAIVETKNFIHSGIFNNSCQYCIFKNTCYTELGLNEKEDKEDTYELFAD